MIEVEIDKYSGFCFGVKKAIETATELLSKGEEVFCVGDIVHNEAESQRLSSLGMSIISNENIDNVTHGTVLFRAHGEPPQSYQKVTSTNAQLKDATCPVVLKLQQRIKKAHQKLKHVNGQIVIFGKRGHAEVIGLLGQTNNEAIVIENEHEIGKIDLTRLIEIYAQTTKDPVQLKKMVEAIKIKSQSTVEWHNTTCKQVTGRVPRIQAFAAKHELILFVGGKKSSNAKVLFEACQQVNPNSYFISSKEEIKNEWLVSQIKSVGVCGATSTPQWLMEEVAESIKAYR